MENVSPCNFFLLEIAIIFLVMEQKETTLFDVSENDQPTEG